MANQLIDKIILNKNEYGIYQTNIGKSLFNPTKYGLNISKDESKKDIACRFLVENNRLYLKHLYISSVDHAYPDLFDIKAVLGGIKYEAEYSFDDSPIALDCTGSAYICGSIENENIYKDIRFEHGIIKQVDDLTKLSNQLNEESTSRIVEENKNLKRNKSLHGSDYYVSDRLVDYMPYHIIVENWWLKKLIEKNYYSPCPSMYAFNYVLKQIELNDGTTIPLNKFIMKLSYSKEKGILGKLNIVHRTRALLVDDDDLISISINDLYSDVNKNLTPCVNKVIEEAKE